MRNYSNYKGNSSYGGFAFISTSTSSVLKRSIPLSLKFVKSLTLFAVVWLSITRVQANEIAIIIDDMGNNGSDSVAFELPREVVFSILPHTPHSSFFSQMAEQQNREVMLHMPMEALSEVSLGQGAIKSYMSRLHIQQTIASAHQSVPNAIGMNNHMGSKLTQLTFPMQATMEYLAENRLFFLDSRTTKFSRAEAIAQRNGVPNAHRHVFLDHIKDVRHISYQFDRLKYLARKNGFAIGIAHPNQVSIDFLMQALPELKAKGYSLVTMGDALQPQDQQWVWNQPGQLSK